MSNRQPDSPTPSQALTDVVLAMLLVVAGGISATVLGELLVASMGAPLLLVLVLQGLIVLAGLYGLLTWRGQGWRDLALPMPTPRDLVRGLLTLLLVFFLNAALSLLMYRLAPGLLETHQQRLAVVAGLLTAGLPFVAVTAVLLFIGFYEELLARGFLLTRCRRLFGGVWGPVLASSALFGLGHFYQGWLGVLQTALVGVVFARLTLHWGTLWPAILAHAALNTASLGMLRGAGGPV